MQKIKEALRDRNVIIGLAVFGVAVFVFLFSFCFRDPEIGEFAQRRGDEIVVAGQMVHTGTPVVLWMDPGGYDAYRVERRFVPIGDSSWSKSHKVSKSLTTPNRYGMRRKPVSEGMGEMVRAENWDLEALRERIDLFIIHYDASGVSRRCFEILHDQRGLSSHFMLDIDGTIYQTLDIKESAWHASQMNSRSIGIEIANVGAYSNEEAKPLQDWYELDRDGRMRITIPAQIREDGVRTKRFVGHSARSALVSGSVHGRKFYQYDFTQEQYEALIKLTAALCKVFPKIKCDYPRDKEGNLELGLLDDERLKKYGGLIGHYHFTTNKVDPGPAFQWDYLIEEARRLME